MAPDNSRSKPRLSYRSAKRRASHAAAHDETHIDDLPDVLDHEQVPDEDPMPITDQGGLDELIAALREAGRFAYDTEFIGEQTYVNKTCLIQVATAEFVALVDPLAGMDLRGFWELLAGGDVLKIVHAGRQDFEPVYESLDCAPANVFDTQIAAGFCGLGYPKGLADTVEAVLGVELEQGPKFSQWDKRPLTDLQLHYAANDVRYLPLLHSRILDRLDETGHTAWAMEECQRLVDESLYAFEADPRRLKASGVGRMSRRQLTKLTHLMRWREAVAREENVPARSLMPDNILADLVKARVDSADQVRHFKGLPRPVKSAYADDIVEVLSRADDADLVEALPRRKRDSDAVKAEIKSRWDALAERCEQMGIERQLVANRRDFTTLMRAVLHGTDHRPDHLITGWQREMLLPIVPELDQAADGE